MSSAICIRCGSRKRAPAARCSSCGFEPTSDSDKARSLILSLRYEMDGVYKGHSRDELSAIGESIRRGQYVFDAAEIARVEEYARSVLAISRARLATDLLKWLLWPIVTLVLFALVIWAAERS